MVRRVSPRCSTLVPRSPPLRRCTDFAQQRTTMTSLHGRRLGPLLTMWAAAALLAVALYWLQATMPALIDMLTPIYVVLGIALLVGTWKWFRWRAPRQDRRLSDRRHAD